MPATRFPLLAAASILLALAPPAGAQSLLPSASIPSAFGTSPGSPPANLMPGTPRTPSTPALRGATGSTNDPLFKLGPIGVRPHVHFSHTYSDGLPSAPGQPNSSDINIYSPGILLDLGTNWTLDYTPEWTNYSSGAFRDSLDHAASFTGAISRGGSGLTFDQSYATSSAPMVETARQTDQEIANTTIGGVYTFNSQFSIQSTASQKLTFIEKIPDFHEWSQQTSLHYRLSADVNMAAGLGAGYVTIHKSADMAYFQPIVQLGWEPSDKLSLQIQGMLERRLFYSVERRWLQTPRYAASLALNPTKTTSVKFTVERIVTPAYFSNQIIDATGWNISVGQRFLQHLQLSANMGNRQSDYLSSGDLQSAGRNDDTRTYQVRLSIPFLRRGTLGAMYSKTENSTDAAGFGLSTEQIGMTAAFKY